MFIMKVKVILAAVLSIAALHACHGTASKDYDKKEKNDPAQIVVPSNSDATNPSLADTANSKKDTTIRK
jgi:hypothetical protein